MAIKSMLSLAILSVSLTEAMQPTTQQINDEAINACMTKLESLPTRVDAETVKNANFNANNNFQVGEIVITPNISGSQYFYSCVTGMRYDMSFPTPTLIIQIKRNHPLRNYSVGFAPGAIGKLSEKKERLP